MVRGKYPREYFKNPWIDKPIEEIYADLDAYSGEYWEDQPQYHDFIEVYVVLPPLLYDGVFIKGLYLTQAVDLVHSLHPELSEYFHSAAYTFWCSYPWSKQANAFCTVYPNPAREAWFRRTHPELADRVFIPVELSDFTHEYQMAPAPVAERDIDVICVSRMHDVKNLPIVAEALKIYRAKHGRIRMALLVGKPFDLNFTALDAHELGELRKMQEILIHLQDYIEIVPNVRHVQMPDWYSRAKVGVLGSLIEGKNRSLLEAMSCNTPVVCFQAFNQYARGPIPAIPEGAGLTAEFDAEALANTLHTVLTDPGELKPRRRFLEHFGRINFLNRCLDSFSYYRERLPDYRAGANHMNPWLDLAIQDNYNLSLYDFLYDKNTTVTRAKTMKGIAELAATYLARFRRKQLPVG